jgi:kynurenine formamidase
LPDDVKLSILIFLAREGLCKWGCRVHIRSLRRRSQERAVPLNDPKVWHGRVGAYRGRGMTGRSNWGRWGPDDQKGALNLLTEERVLHALSLPREGRVFTLGTEVSRRGPLVGAHRNPTWNITMQFQVPDDSGRGRAEDLVVMHTHAHTHIDGLSHVWYDGLVYGGVPAARAVSRLGTRHASVEHYGSIIGTALILDVSQVRPLAEGDQIGPADLDAAAAAAGMDPADADILLVRTGWFGVWEGGPDRYGAGEPGLGPAGAAWLADRDPAAIGMDNFGIDPFPAPEGVQPLACHELFLRDLGVPLIENLDLSSPAAAGVTQGLFVATPLKIRRGLGSPLNPILVV